MYKALSMIFEYTSFRTLYGLHLLLLRQKKKKKEEYLRNLRTLKTFDTSWTTAKDGILSCFFFFLRATNCLKLIHLSVQYIIDSSYGYCGPLVPCGRTGIDFVKIVKSCNELRNVFSYENVLRTSVSDASRKFSWKKKKKITEENILEIENVLIFEFFFLLYICSYINYNMILIMRSRFWNRV